MAEMIEVVIKLPVKVWEDCCMIPSFVEGWKHEISKAFNDGVVLPKGGQKDILEQLSVTPKEKIGHCKDCKWWKDSDGVYRRGIGAESRCPINCKAVYEGNGYCFVYEPQESENNNGN